MDDLGSASGGRGSDEGGSEVAPASDRAPAIEARLEQQGAALEEMLRLLQGMQLQVSDRGGSQPPSSEQRPVPPETGEGGVKEGGVFGKPPLTGARPRGAAAGQDGQEIDAWTDYGGSVK